MLTALCRTPPKYRLTHNIVVYHENFTKRYVMCKITAPQRLFPRRTPDAQGYLYVQRARVVMTAKMGRALRWDEHVHHKKGLHDDVIRHLELKPAAEHQNEHHKGLRHSASVKERIRKSLKKAYAEGRHKKPDLRGKKNPFFGKKHTDETRKKMSLAKSGKQ